MTQHMVVIRPTQLSNFLFGGDPLAQLAVEIGQEEWTAAPEGGRSSLVLHFAIHAAGDCAPGHAIILASVLGWEFGYEIRRSSLFPLSHSPGVLNGNPRACPESLAPALDAALRSYVASRILAERGSPADGKLAQSIRVDLLWDGEAYRPTSAGWVEVL